MGAVHSRIPELVPRVQMYLLLKCGVLVPMFLLAMMSALWGFRLWKQARRGYRPTLMDRDLQQPLYAAQPVPISGMPMMSQQMMPMNMQGGPTWPYAPQQGGVRQVTPQYAQQQMMYAQQQQPQYAVNYPMGVTGAVQRSSAEAAAQSGGAGQVTLA